MQQLKLSEFDFSLPKHLIAQSPVHPRDHSRLLVYHRRDKTINDDQFFNLRQYLPTDSTLVLNNSRVEKARLLFGNTEIFILRQVNPKVCEALVRPGRRFRSGKTVRITEKLDVWTLDVAEDGVRLLEFSIPANDPHLDAYRLTPFPPYIRQDERLAAAYQTVYAKDSGSKAAPTAGLHFTPDLLGKLRENGTEIAEVTLHVGLGTFAPVKTDTIEEHKMHSEWFSIDEQAATTLNNAQHITAVGTTSVRVLESAVLEGRKFRPGSGDTDIFITPGYRFRCIDSLITNFHLPKSTLLMLVSALAGLDEMHRIYQHAISSEYRFFSFGDAMLII